MPVDSFAFLPRSFRGEYETVANPPAEPTWAPLAVPIQEARVALLTSAGIYLRGRQQPFDLDGERANPMWGDPTYRVIPTGVSRDQIGVSHLHINPADILEDFNVALPIDVFADLAADGVIGSVADEHFSFMGYQSRDLADWRRRYGPEVVRRLEDGHVDALVLAPA